MGTDEPVFLDGSGLSLAQALGVQRGEVVVLVGAGGKTTSMFRLASELAAAGERVLVTTTTKILPPLPHEAPATILGEDLESLLAALRAALDAHPIVAVARGLDADGKLLGVDPNWLGLLREVAGVANVLVEADGSAGRPFKAPAAYEPVIPASADLVVPVAGLSVLGQPLSPACVHRPERVAALAGVAPGTPITTEVVAAVLVHPEGCTRGAPPGARVVPLLNQADDEPRLEAGRRVARDLLRLGARRVAIAAVREACPVRELATSALDVHPLHHPTRVSAIVLAGGEARRMGFPKLGLQLGGKSLLRRVVDAALGARVDEVVVVLGHGAAELEKDLPQNPRLRLVHNARYAEGQSTSLKVGVAALNPAAAAAIFLLGDQPLIDTALLDTLVCAYRLRCSPLVLPLYRGVPGHPVLFARSLFPELLQLIGDRGGREVLARHRAAAATVDVDREAPGDVDTWEDYTRLANQLHERWE